LEFYDTNDEKIQGKVMGISETNVTQGEDKAFDGDVSTFFSTPSNVSSWVGMDLGESRKIGRIRYLPRTDGDGIYEGHEYELWYWDEGQWKSLGKKTATSHVLQYEAPDNVLFYVKNLTLNKIHSRPFVIEAGAQKWL
jgi:hypothetical protein